LSNAICATGVNSVGIHLKGAANMAPLPIEIQLTTFDLNTAPTVPDAAGTAAGLHSTTNNLIAALVTPDVAGTAAGLHDTTNGLINALASVTGALTDAAAAGDVTETYTLMQYAKQLINILIGTPGIVTFPDEAAPADAVSLAEVIRAIYNDVTHSPMTFAGLRT